MNALGIVVHPNIDVKEVEKHFSDFRIVRITNSEQTAENGSWKGVDLLVSIGGDGTFLTTARIAATHQIPMIGICVPASPQSKPFLPDIPFDAEFKAAKRFIVDYFELNPDKVYVERRHFLKGEINGEKHIAINEIIIGKNSLMGTVTVRVDVRNRTEENARWTEVLSVRADMTMLATATGSTGYSMSTGGPLIHPEDASVVCAHVAPIGFGQRHVVLPGKHDVKMKLVYGNSAAVSFDCQLNVNIKPGDEVVISRGHYYTVYRRPDWNFFDRARSVLNWGG